MMVEAKSWITADEAAEMLSVTGRRVRQLLKKGELEGQKFGKQKKAPWMVSYESVKAVQERRQARI